MAQSTTTGGHRFERVIAYISAAMVVISLVSIFANLIGAFFGNSGRFNEGFWPVVALIPVIALPIAFLLILTLLITVTVRRSRAG